MLGDVGPGGPEVNRIMEGKKHPLQQKLEDVYRTKIGFRLSDAKEFGKGVGAILLLAKASGLPIEIFNEIIATMQECVESSELKDSEFWKLVKEELETLEKLKAVQTTYLQLNLDLGENPVG